MSTPTFQIVTVDNQAYREGSPVANQFTGLVSATADTPRLESFEHDGDFVQLRYTGGLTIGIPEHRIAHIAEYHPNA